MNITLKQLSYFIALTEQRNFGRAAQVVHISQPALSVQIRSMETELGQALVERQARDIVLTPFGRLILAHARRVMAEVQGLKQAARWQGGLKGRLSLGVIPTIAPYILPATLEALRGADVSLDVEITEAKTDQLIAALRAGHLDAALMALPSGAGGLLEQPLFEDRFMLAGSAQRMAELGVSADKLRPDELGNSALLLLEDGHCLTDQALEICGRGRGHGRINMGASSLATLSKLVAAGFGLTLLPELAINSETRAAPGMILRRFAAPEPARQIGLVRRDTTGDEGWFQDLAMVLRDVGRTLTMQVRG